MPIPSTGEIKLNDDVNATLQADTNESNVSLGDNNTVKFTAVGDGTTVSGRSMSELRGQSLFQINPSTEATGALGESLHMDGLSSSHNSVKVLEPTLTTAPVFTNTRGTFSFWVKIHETEAGKRYLYTSGTADGSLVSILLHSSGTLHDLQVRINNLSYYVTKAIFIDKAGWYNFVVSLDSNVPQDDIKVNCYANGIRLTWVQVANMSDGQAIQFGTNQRINDWAFADGYGADATYANFIFVEGSALLPNEFGELRQGIWVPKGVNTPSSQSLVTTNLVADYQFQGNANDTSVGGTTYNGTPSNVTFQQNNYNIASFTGGSASQISLGASSQFTSSTLTFSFWYMPTAAPSGTTYKILFANYTTGSLNFYVIRHTDNSLEFGFITGSSGTWYRRTGPNAVELNNWKHYSFVLDSSQSTGNKLKVYIDGSLFAHNANGGTSTTGNFLNSSNNLLIGNWAHQGGYTDTSKFGEVQIYTSALTETQVLQNFNSTKYKYFYGLNGWHLNFNNSDQESIVSGSIINLDAGDWDADGTDETSFSGTAWNDKSGNNHHATLTNGPAYSSNNGGYFLFDGSDDFATITSNSSFQSLADFSLEMWIYPVTVSDDEMINLLYTSGSNYKWDLRFGSGSSQNFRFGVANSGGGYTSAQDLTTNTTTGTVPLNKWSHVVATFSSTNGSMNIYINGALTDTKAGTFTTRTNGSENLLLAKRTDGYHANIGIAQSRVYSKALTAQEVVQNFRATQGHYTVLSLADISGNAKGGIANGTNLNSSDHTGDKPDVAFPTFTQEGSMTSGAGKVTNGGLTVSDDNDGGSLYARFSGPSLPQTGKWYWEVNFTPPGSGSGYVSVVGISNIHYLQTTGSQSMWEHAASNGIHSLVANGNFRSEGSSSATSITSYESSSGTYGWAYDADGGTLHIYANGSIQNSGNPLVSNLSGPKKIVAQAATLSYPISFNFGAKGFSYTPPSGYKALSSDNLLTATNVDPLNQKKPRDYFESVKYNGTGVRNEIKSLDFQPDFIWIQNIKSTSGYYSALIDSVRGVNSILSTNSTGVEQTSYLDQLESFDTNGFSLGNNSGGGNYANLAGNNYIAWAWKAGGTPTVDNTASAGAAPTPGSVMIDGVASTADLAGSIAATKISANTKSGFSIVSFTGNDTAGVSVAHGLGVKPQLILFKARTRDNNWGVYAEPITANKFLVLNNNAAEGDATEPFNDTEPTSSIITLSTSLSFNNAGTMVAYCFHSVNGYSKIGSYTGTGDANKGPTIFTGFKPAWIVVKRTDSSGAWNIFDNKRNPTNPRNAILQSDKTDQQYINNAYNINFHSNGFKLRNSHADWNASNAKYIFMCFAEDPAKYAQGTGQTSDTEKFLEIGTGTTQYPANHFKAVAYSGTLNPVSSSVISSFQNVGFSPGLLWVKGRSFTSQNRLFDSVRGASAGSLKTNGTDAQATASGQTITSLDSNGFTAPAVSGDINQSGQTFISYNWKAGDTIETKKPTYTSAGILTSNLALHYNFADSNTYAGTGTTVYDLTSNDKDGTLVNTPTWVDTANGNYFDFDGSNDHITTGYTQPAGSAVTYEFWVNFENESQRHSIAGSLDSNGSNATGVIIEVNASNAFFFGIGDGTNYVTTPTADRPTVEKGKWKHLVVSQNGTAVKMYVNGILLSQYTSSINFSNVAKVRQYYLGSMGQYVSGAMFDGKFAQARIYTAELTQAQIKANYDATRTLYQGVGTTANVLQTGLLNNIDADSFSSYDPNSFGTTNQVAVFNGSNGYIDTGLNQNVGNNFTWSLWFNSDISDSNYRLLIDKTNPSSPYPGAGIALQGGYVYGMINGTGTYLTYTGNSYSTNQWYHAVLTSNGSTVKLYLNSVEVGTGSVSTANTSQNILIGDSVTWTTNYDGLIDQTRIFSSALTADQVKILYNETSSTTSTLNPTGLSNCIALYNFDSDSGTTVDDVSTNYDGTASSVTFAFDNTTGYRAKDQTSNNLSGGLMNATFNEANDWGTSIKFDGTGDFVSLPVGLGRTATQDVTRELWVKIDDLPAGSNSDGLLYIGDMGTSQYYENLRVTSDGTIDYQERPNAGTGGAQDFILSTNSYAGTLSVGVWYHVAYTVQGRLKKIYINGKLVATKTASYDKVNNSAYGGSLGSFRGVLTTTTQGEIAQFRSYTSALTDTQIKANYDATKAQFYSALMHSSVSVNEKAGFSIAKHKGDGVLSSRITHGLSSQPDFLVVKNMDTASTSWATWLSVFSSPSETLFLDSPGRSTQYTDRVINVSETTFQAGNAGSGTAASSEVNKDGDELIVYAWKSIPGYSKIGRYKGTGASGHSIEIGFQPSWVIIKNITNAGSTGWVILDAARDSINDNGNAIFASLDIAEWGASNTTINIDFTPTGFEIQNSYVVVNGSSDSYIYMAFA